MGYSQVTGNKQNRCDFIRCKGSLGIFPLVKTYVVDTQPLAGSHMWMTKGENYIGTPLLEFLRLNSLVLGKNTLPRKVTLGISTPRTRKKAGKSLKTASLSLTKMLD